VRVEAHVNDQPSETAAPLEIIGIGASAGGLQPLKAVVAALPRDLPVSVLVVLHVAPAGTSVLPQILARATTMEVVAGEDGVELAPGRIVVARPDRHLLVHDGSVRLSRGPRENGHRPAVDPLLRSMADVYGPRAAGVILSGARDDGTQGLAAIKRRGGVALVQDPEEAEYPAMPANAMAATAIDFALPAAQLGATLVELVGGNARRAPGSPLATPSFGGEPAGLKITCPDCGGVLTETDDGGVVHFRCHVGHAYSPANLLALHADGVERALWTAARSLVDRGALLRRLAERARVAGNTRSAEQFDATAEQADAEAAEIRRAIAALDDAYTADAPEAPGAHETSR
jgi:two-component system chemotaxis response regulator CheB